MASAKLALVADVTTETVHAPDALSPLAKAWRLFAARRGQVIRVGIGVSLLAAGAAIYAPDILYTTSSEAVINARTVTIAAPIGGRVVVAPPAEGTSVNADTPLLRIDNPVVDRGHLSDLEATRTRTAAELDASAQLIKSLEQQIGTLDTQAATYRTAAIDRLDLAAREAQAELVAAQSNAAEADRTLARKQSLSASGWVSTADLDAAQRAATSADANAERARLAAKRLADEADAARRGVFINDSTNGAPYAQQRVDEFRLRLAEAKANASASQARLAQLEDEIAAEKARVEHLSTAELRLRCPALSGAPTSRPGRRSVRTAS
jgi:multidrug resistance efflux pump